MTRLLYLHFIVAVTALSALTAGAQTIVAGRVLDHANRAPIAGITVELIGARDTVVQTGSTGSDGTFTLSVPSGGIYRVRFVVGGAPTHVSDTISVAEGEFAAREFRLDLSWRPLSGSRGR